MFFFIACSFAVLDVSDRNEASVIGGARASLVTFYFPGCVWCQKMAEPFAAASSNDITDVIYAKVDCSANEKLCQQFEVSGYPTVMYFKAGSKKGVEYQGDRSSESFQKFVQLQDSENSDRPMRATRRRHRGRGRNTALLDRVAKQLAKSQ